MPPPPPPPVVPLALATGQDASSLAVDAEALYFTSRNQGVVARADKRTGRVTPLAIGESQPDQLAVHAGKLYFTTRVGRMTSIRALPTTPGSSAVTVASALFEIPSFAVDDTGLYWPQLGEGATIAKTPLDGGPATPVGFVPAPPFSMGLGSGEVFALGSYQLYAVTLGTASQPRQVNDMIAYLFSLAVDGTHAYMLADGGVGTVPLAGGAIQMLAARSIPSSGIAIDDASVYYADDHSVSKVAKSGGAPRALAPATQASSVVIDVNSVYFIDRDAAGHDTIFRAQKD